MPFLDAIWLYGSRARGDAKESSDIAIVCPRATVKDWLVVCDLLEETDTLLKIDFLRFDELAENDELLKKNILQEKIVFLKRKNNHARACKTKNAINL